MSVHGIINNFYQANPWIKMKPVEMSLTIIAPVCSRVSIRRYGINKDYHHLKKGVHWMKLWMKNKDRMGGGCM